MERSSITKWLFIGLAIFLFATFGWPLIMGKKTEEPPPAFSDGRTAPTYFTASEQVCSIEGDRFRADVSSRGATLKKLTLTDPRYHAVHVPKDTGILEELKKLFLPSPPRADEPMNLVNTSQEVWWRARPDAPAEQRGRMPLRTDLRAPEGEQQQVAFDDFDWKLDPSKSDKSRCTFTFEDASTRLTKTITATGKPYELSVKLDVTNLAAEPKRHRLTVEETDWRTPKELEGHLGRQSEFMTKTDIGGGDKTHHYDPSDFKPEDFAKGKEFTPEKWKRAPGEARIASVGSIYFAKILIPSAGPGPVASEARVDAFLDANRKGSDPVGHLYRARLAFATQTLAPNATASYEVLSYHGPKDRKLLEGLGHGSTEVLDHGWFPPIVKALVWYLHKIHGVLGTWGWAIMVLTITVRILVFPLSLSQIKNSVAMRRLKPEMDAINEKYKDDATQRGLAIQELWRKNKVANPVVGCLPMLLQMPVWWALYTALQTEVALYHTPFGPVIPDLSAPGNYLIIPIVLGASSFFQQKLMPPQGDPQQQKMMLYMMPAIFTFMMLFLPAGLGVYMLTNSLLAIGQQLLVERYLKSRAEPPGQIEVREKSSGDGDKPAPTLGKGKARARG